MRSAARVLKALADESRLGILWLLHKHGELCVCDLMEALGITQSKASRHLATLRHAGIVADRRVGTWVHYSLRPPSSVEEAAVLDAVFALLGTFPEAKERDATFRAWCKSKKRKAICHKESPAPTTQASARTSRVKSNGQSRRNGVPR